MSSNHSDSLLDAQLRDVPLPGGLLVRLKQVGIPSDEQLDQQLRSVDVPPEMVPRVQQSVADDMLDQALCDVPLPWGLVARLQMIARLPPRRRFARLALAASLMLLTGGGYLAALAGLLNSVAGRPRVEELVFVYNGPLEIRAKRTLVVELPEASPSSDSAAPSMDFAAIDNLQFVHYDQTTRGPAGEMLATFQTGLPMSTELLRLQWPPGTLGAPQRADDNLPELETISLPAARGIELPLVRQYPRRFELAHGVHAPVVPGAHDALRTVVVPLTTGTGSYDLTARRIQEGRLPSKGEIRVEDFIAAMKYPFAVPLPGQLGIRTAAGPSIFGEPLSIQRAQECGLPLLAQQRACLLQISVQAGSGPSRALPATHLTVALDISASMRWSSRLEVARRALRQLVDHLGPQDRLSLVVFNDEVVPVVEEARREHAAELLQVIDRLQPRGGTNIGAALQEAVSKAIGGTLNADIAQRLVVMTDGQWLAPKESVTQIEELLHWAAERGLRLSVLDLSDREAVDPVWSRLAAAAGGEVRSALAEDRLGWSLLEILTGSSCVVAADAGLSVTFDPQSVAAYRLLGHESSAATPLAGQPIEVDLRAGESASALFEVWLKPGAQDTVAVAEVTWRDPGTGELKRVRQRISRLQFATSLAESPLSLQAAAVAAETGEVLRESFFSTSKSRSLQAVLEAAAQVNPRLAQSANFQQFVSLVERIEHVRQTHPGN